MKIILNKDIENLGLGGDIVEVADGYARNYLLPKKIAILATKKNINKIEGIKVQAKEEREKLLKEIAAIAKELDGEVFTFERKVDESEHLFGSVSQVDIQKEIEDKFANIKKYTIEMENSIKELGEFDLKVKFTGNSEANIKIVVNKEE